MRLLPSGTERAARVTRAGWPAGGEYWEMRARIGDRNLEAGAVEDRRSRCDVEFEGWDGTRLRGWWYAPETSAAAPAVAMAHGFSAVKEMALDRYAAAFHEAGMGDAGKAETEVQQALRLDDIVGIGRRAGHVLVAAVVPLGSAHAAPDRFACRRLGHATLHSPRKPTLDWPDPMISSSRAL